MTENTPTHAELIRQRATEMMEDRDGDLALADAMLTMLAEHEALAASLGEIKKAWQRETGWQEFGADAFGVLIKHYGGSMEDKTFS